MRSTKIALSALVTFGMMCGVVVADHHGSYAECPTAKKVNSLLERWEAATTKAQTMTVAQKQQFGKDATALAAKCPVGSRMDCAVSSVRDALGFAVTSYENCKADCPVTNSTDARCDEAKELMAMRSEGLKKLHKLASYTAGMTSGEAAATCATEGKEAICPIRVASRLGAAKAKFATAREEAATMTASQRREIFDGCASLASQNEAITLMPESIAALAEGFDKLDEVQNKLMAWAKANPEMMKDVPAAMHQTMMMEMALLDEAHQVLDGVTGAMKTMESDVAMK